MAEERKHRAGPSIDTDTDGAVPLESWQDKRSRLWDEFYRAQDAVSAKQQEVRDAEEGLQKALSAFKSCKQRLRKTRVVLWDVQVAISQFLPARDRIRWRSLNKSWRTHIDNNAMRRVTSVLLAHSSMDLSLEERHKFNMFDTGDYKGTWAGWDRAIRTWSRSKARILTHLARQREDTPRLTAPSEADRAQTHKRKLERENTNTEKSRSIPTSHLTRTDALFLWHGQSDFSGHNIRREEHKSSHFLSNWDLRHCASRSYGVKLVCSLFLIPLQWFEKNISADKEGLWAATDAGSILWRLVALAYHGSMEGLLGACRVRAVSQRMKLPHYGTSSTDVTDTRTYGCFSLAWRLFTMSDVRLLREKAQELHYLRDNESDDATVQFAAGTRVCGRARRCARVGCARPFECSHAGGCGAVRLDA